MSTGSDTARRRLRPRLFAALAIFAVFANFAGANAHLIYVAVATQPDCVSHRVGPDGSPAPYRAAKTAR